EKAAKNAGRDALTLTVCRRSGEHTAATLPWSLAGQLDSLVQQFVGSVSDRWTYKLRAELPALEEVPWAAVVAETARLLDRLEAPDRSKLKEHRQAALQFLADYHREMIDPRRWRRRSDTEKKRNAEALGGFVALCQSAAFLARGRDE